MPASASTASVERPGRVALFCTNFLPYSQSFVFEELRGHLRYRAEVFCWRRLFADRFPFEPVHRAGLGYILTRHSRRFFRRLGDGRFDLVHAHFGPGATYALPYAERAGLPLVVTFHGYDVPLLSSRERFLPLNLPYALRAPRMLRDMTLGLCASTELRDLLLELGVSPERLRVHRLGIDLSEFSPAPKPDAPLRVIMVGRFAEKKGFEYGIRGFARTAQTIDSPVLLTLVGSGELEPQLRRLVDELGIERHVEFAGVLRKSEVIQRLRRSHVLLAPSVVARDGNRESGLMVVKEASACETVPIGTRHGGIPEIIDDERTGYLVPERDSEALAARLVTLCQQPELRRSLGRAARAKMTSEYDNRQRVAALEDIYDEARRLYPPRH